MAYRRLMRDDQQEASAEEEEREVGDEAQGARGGAAGGPPPLDLSSLYTLLQKSIQDQEREAYKQDMRWRSVQIQLNNVHDELEKERRNVIEGRQQPGPDDVGAPLHPRAPYSPAAPPLGLQSPAALPPAVPLSPTAVPRGRAASSVAPAPAPDPAALTPAAWTRAAVPKLEEGDDVEQYLTTFERLAVAYRWPRTEWAVYLVPYLSGRARAAYVAMDIYESGDYDRVKAAILAKYEINEETYRQRFREPEVRPGETPRELYSRLKDLYRKWVKPAGKTVEEIGEVFILEQYLRTLAPEVRVWVKEHNPATGQHAADLVEAFLAARPGPKTFRMQSYNRPAGGGKSGGSGGGVGPRVWGQAAQPVSMVVTRAQARQSPEEAARKAVLDMLPFSQENLDLPVAVKVRKSRRCHRDEAQGARGGAAGGPPPLDLSSLYTLLQKSIQDQECEAYKQDMRWRSVQIQLNNVHDELEKEQRNVIEGRQQPGPDDVGAPLHPRAPYSPAAPPLGLQSPAALPPAVPLSPTAVPRGRAASSVAPAAAPDPAALTPAAWTRATVPKLEEGDDVEQYLTTFERLAVAYRWPRTEWAVYLVPYLSGRARAAYVAMDIYESGDYDRVKAAILAKYEINEETYRQRFREPEVRPGETPRELYSRLKDLYRKWVKPAGKTVEEIGEVFILEQYLRTLAPEVRVWVKEHNPATGQHAADLVEAFLAARPGPKTFRMQSYNRPAGGGKSGGSGGGVGPRGWGQVTYKQDVVSAEAIIKESLSQSAYIITGQCTETQNLSILMKNGLTAAGMVVDVVLNAEGSMSLSANMNFIKLSVSRPNFEEIKEITQWCEETKNFPLYPVVVLWVYLNVSECVSTKEENDEASTIRILAEEAQKRNILLYCVQVSYSKASTQWERTVNQLCEITAGLIRQRSSSFIGQILQA
ncbi:hypothetical protein ACEWY4_020586 [Coilia grayii]|uniref:SCAN box domain-containing protein n=1 Tax=Coilia grayii TaxID=363190 RepID=A0ABD1JG57_9TELE